MTDSSLTPPARLATWALAAYAAVLFTATHVPLPPGVLDRGPSDKTLHLAAYFVLGLLSAARLRLRGRSGRVWIAWWFGLLAVAAGDELTQPWVGRIADWQDWLADAIGTSAALLTAWLSCRRA